MVFARITMHNGIIWPMGYAKYDAGNLNKDLLFPIPGVYGENFLNPLQKQEFTPILTGDDGTVSFMDLKFSVYGPAG